jgi:hypothetical protein
LPLAAYLFLGMFIISASWWFSWASSQRRVGLYGDFLEVLRSRVNLLTPRLFRKKKITLRIIHAQDSFSTETLQHSLEFENFIPRHISGILQTHLLAERGSFFGGDDRGLLKEGFKTY